MRDCSKNSKEVKKPDKIVESLAQIDLSGLGIVTIAVFEYPEDYPRNYVGRVISIKDGQVRETDTVILKKSLTDLQEDIDKNNNMGMIWTIRTKEDVKSLRGVWI